jgi:hypothetical protein
LESQDSQNSRAHLKSNDRVLPKPERFASCPDDGRILEYYHQQFESVYVLLHPSLKPLTIALERFCSDDRPGDNEILEGVTPVTWSEIISQSQFENIQQIDIALRASISGIKSELMRQDLSEILDKYNEENRTLSPEEGDLSLFILYRLLKAVKRTGVNYLWVGDEFATERKLTFIEDITGEEIPYHGCLFTHDHTLLVTTHWDCHCSFLCSSRKTIDEILAHDKFEGFFCTEKTHVFWGLHDI